MTGPGSAAHQALIARFTAHYQADPRVLAIAVFGSVSTGAWHELSDVDLDVVVADDVPLTQALPLPSPKLPPQIAIDNSKNHLGPVNRWVYLAPDGRLNASRTSKASMFRPRNTSHPTRH
jgi:hypothetical protein